MSAEQINLTLLTEHEVASLVRKSIHWLRRQRWQGGPHSIPYRKIGFSVRYDQQDVQTWLKSQSLQTSTSEGK
jgi:hypothetical protein